MILLFINQTKVVGKCLFIVNGEAPPPKPKETAPCLCVVTSPKVQCPMPVPVMDRLVVFLPQPFDRPATVEP